MAITKIKLKPTWMKHTQKEIDAIVVKLAKQGLTSEKIGLTLRDSYGVPKAKLLGKSVSKILKENKLYKDTDMKNLGKKEESIKSHLEKNKQDKRARRALTIINARIRKRKKYSAKKKN